MIYPLNEQNVYAIHSYTVNKIDMNADVKKQLQLWDGTYKPNTNPQVAMIKKVPFTYIKEKIQSGYISVKFSYAKDKVNGKSQFRIVPAFSEKRGVDTLGDLYQWSQHPNNPQFEAANGKGAAKLSYFNYDAYNYGQYAYGGYYYYDEDVYDEVRDMKQYYFNLGFKKGFKKGRKKSNPRYTHNHQRLLHN